MSHVSVYTPASSSLSSGLSCFDVKGIKAATLVDKMHKKGIIMSSTSYEVGYARFAPSLKNNQQEIELALAEIKAMA